MTQPTTLVPGNAIERSMAAAMEGRITQDAFLGEFLESDIVVPSATEVGADGSGFTPLIFDKAGTPMVAVFSSLERATKFQAQARFALTIHARRFLAGLRPGAGIVVNPGYDVGLDIGPSGIRNILRIPLR